MANKFQRSVQERLQKEAQRKPPKIEEAQPESTNATVVTLPVPTEEQVIPAKIQDISAYLRSEKDRVAKNKTFYLDTEVIDALHAAAKRANSTDSRLCNDILRTVLGLNQ